MARILLTLLLWLSGTRAYGQLMSEADRAAGIAVVKAAGGRVALSSSSGDVGTIYRVEFGPKVKDESLRSLLAVSEAQAVWLGGAFWITDQGLAPLAKLPRLSRVNLMGCIKVGDSAMDHLKGATGLLELNVSHTQVTGIGLAKLSKLEKLEQLNISRTSMGDDALRLVEKWPRLRELRAIGTPVTDAGLANLKEAKNLVYLYLSDTKVSDAGMVHLTQLPKLRWIVLGGSKVTDKGVQTLKKSLPKARIILDN